MFTKF